MFKSALVFEASRDAYSIDSAAERDAMTVGELIRILQDYNEDDLVIMSHDRGYTYGSIHEREMTLYQENEDGEFEEAWDC